MITPARWRPRGSVARPHSSLDRRKTRRLEELVRERHHQRAVLLRFATLLDPLRMGRDRAPLLLALGPRLVGDQINQIGVRLTDLGGPEARLFDAVLFKQL